METKQSKMFGQESRLKNAQNIGVSGVSFIISDYIYD